MKGMPFIRIWKSLNFLVQTPATFLFIPTCYSKSLEFIKNRRTVASPEECRICTSGFLFYHSHAHLDQINKHIDLFGGKKNKMATKGLDLWVTMGDDADLFKRTNCTSLCVMNAFPINIVRTEIGS